MKRKPLKSVVSFVLKPYVENMAPWKHSTCHTTRLLYQSWMSNVFAIPWNFNSLRRNYVPVPWIIDASDSNTQCLYQKRLFTWKSLLVKHNYKLWWGRKHCTWSILTKWLKRVQKGRLAQLGFCISCCPRNMNSYCYGLVKWVVFIAKGCFYRNKINAMSILNRNPEIHYKIILKMFSGIWKFY